MRRQEENEQPRRFGRARVLRDRVMLVGSFGPHLAGPVCCRFLVNYLALKLSGGFDRTPLSREVQSRTTVVNTPRLNRSRCHWRSVSNDLLANLSCKDAIRIELIANNDW